jgi:hypothetical protein
VQGGEVTGFIQRGQGVIAFILALLQLVGVLLGLVLTTFVIGQYIRYIRPRHFIFEGFSNAPKSSQAEIRTWDLNSLAREELVNQLEELYSHWAEASGLTPLDINLLLADDPCLRKNSHGDSNVTLSPEKIKCSGMMEDLEAVIAQQNPQNMDLMGMIGGIVPKEASLITKLINELIPPHATKAVGHLQWKQSVPGSGDIGITLELEDLGEQRNCGLQTLWRLQACASFDHTPTPENVNPHTESDLDDKSNNLKSSEKELLRLTAYYTELLTPAMRWLALLFFEQQQTLHIPFLSRIPFIRRIPALSQREQRRQAQLHYILEALYFDSAAQHTMDSPFFWKLAIKHFRQAVTLDPHWYLPYLHMANMYSIEMEKQIQKRNIKESNELLEYALTLYDKAFNLAEKADWFDRSQKSSTQERHAGQSVTIPVGNIKDINAERIEWYEKLSFGSERSEQKDTKLAEYPQIPVEEWEYAKQRVIIARAWTELIWCGGQSEARAEREAFVRQKVEALVRLDPAKFDPEREDCGTYLYDLMIWYLIAAIQPKENTAIKEDQKKRKSNDMDYAKLYLVYCLARSWNMRAVVHRALRNIGTGSSYAFIRETYLKRFEKEWEETRKVRKENDSQSLDSRAIKGSSVDEFKEAVRKVVEKCAFDDKEAIIQCMSTCTDETRRGL